MTAESNTPSAGRVRVCVLGPDHATELATLLAGSAEFHRGWVSYPTEPAQVAGFVGGAAAAGMLVFGVRHNDNGVLVGLATLCRITGEPWLTAEYGCAVGAHHRGHGYLTEATVLCARYAFTALALHRVEALVRPENTASIRMLTAAGFRPEGTARGAVRIGGAWIDHVRWAVTADEPAVAGPFQRSERR